MSVQTDLEARTAKLRAILEDSNAALEEKGGTAADDLAGLPAAIENLDSGVELDALEIEPTGQKIVVEAEEGRGFNIVTVTGSKYPVHVVPEEYREYVDYARENLYDGDYAHLLISDWEGNNLVVGFLMEDFSIESYNEGTSEYSAKGWVSCWYVPESGEWGMSDMRETAGSSYAGNIVYASCPIEYGAQRLFPLPIHTESDITGVNMDNFDNGSFTVTYASGNSEEITLLYDDSGAVIGVQDSLGNQVTVSGV